MSRIFTMGIAAAVLAGVAAACGGGSSSSSTPSTPTSPSTPGTGGNPQTATITIGADGQVTPSSVTIARGGRVLFINNHNAAHDMASDPHPEHTDCPAINDAGFLSPGQQRQTGNLNTARTCRFHDHINFSNNGLKGTIVIQ